MLRAVGFETDDFNKPQIGVASTWSMVTPGNMHINDLAKHAESKAMMVVKELCSILLLFLMASLWEQKA